MKLDDKKRDLITNRIYNEILETYPFLSLEEEVAYKNKAKVILANSIFTDSLEEVNKLLGLLQNPHADTWLVKDEVNRMPPQKPDLSIENDICYIKVPAWTKRLENLAEDLISFCIESEGKYKALIIDVRDNTGGSSFIAHKFAGIFFKEDISFGKFIKRIKGQGLQEKESIMKANGKYHIDKPIVMITSHKCFSSNELFLAPFNVTGRATLIGEKTAGGSGNPIEIDMEIEKRKYIARIPTWRFILKGENRPIEETAILPDIFYTKKDIVGYARKYLKDKLL